MSYNSEIKAIQLKPMAELYHVQSGIREWFYTSYCRDVVWLGDTYLARMIKTQIPTKDDNLKANQIQVSLPVVPPFGEYIANTPVEPTLITITEIFLHDATAFKVLFTGKVLGVTFVANGNVGIAVADFESTTVYFRNKIPKNTYKSYCNNTLYYPSDPDDPNCNLNREDFRQDAIITISENTLISVIFGGNPDGYFIGGEARTSYGDRRLITNHVGNVITLANPFDARLTSGDTVSVYPGCDKSPDDCINKFNNFPRFIGFPFVPSNNPTLFGADR